MLHLKSEVSNDLVPFSSPTSASQELEHWEKLIFAFDMEREQGSGSRNTQGSRTPSGSNTTGQHNLGLGENAALLAQLEAAARSGELSHAYASMLSQNPYPSMNPSPGFYGNFLHHNPMPPAPPTQLPPLSSLDFPWHALPHQHMQPGPGPIPPHYGQHQGPLGTGPPLPFIDTTLNNPGPSSEPARTNRRVQRSPSTPRGGHSGHSTSSPEVEQTEGERQAIAEEKRRRNTAASARFRIKKKHKTLELERSVSDLTGRAEELEREAADLRRENGWLKEIVMLKGARYAASNMANSEALAQAAALAASEQRASGSSSRAQASTSKPREQEEASSGSEESDSSDEEEDIAPTSKGKGKQPASKRK
ncbi:hypothetical protein CVT26_010914 [Gymnopilus dilepis]|uniref:BZIP domain-containing protein n=1 Tax=Gymnopilus dilepis TaxID=231916 RepID=A0A409VIP8_9AGAR|nr:hypothetical protein CVT26_010914 [Gymnopilus dilepis]